MHLKFPGKSIDLSCPRVMGVLNVTPDSFSDGGQFVNLDMAIERAEQMAAEGASIIDVGGESTRPGSSPVPVNEELDRIIPVIEKIHESIDAPISVDTSKPEVMRAAIEAGAGMINDVFALRSPGALEVAAELGVPVCIMHMLGKPKSMQDAPVYEDVVAEVKQFLESRARAALDAGVANQHILLDPGFGFGKTLAHNLVLLGSLGEIDSLGYPVLVGISRKAMIGKILDQPASERVAGSVAAAMIAVQQGAKIVRVHDVKATQDALKILGALENETA